MRLIHLQKWLKNRMEIEKRILRTSKKVLNAREGSQKNKDLFKNINDKLQDKTFIEQAIE